MGIPWESHENHMGMEIPVPMHTSTRDQISLSWIWDSPQTSALKRGTNVDTEKFDQ